jgi:hypothetical protein
MYLLFFLLLVRKKETKKKTPKKMLPFAHAWATPLFGTPAHVFHSFVWVSDMWGFRSCKVLLQQKFFTIDARLID